MDLLLLGKEPISSDSPTGSDVRYDPEFESLQAEIDKMSMPSASGGIDWATVNKLATGILAGKAKDLLVASYLAVAQIHTNKVEGFETGITVYRDLLAQFWEDLFPTKKRKKGRVAAIEWWIEKSESALEGLKINPLPGEKIEEYRKILQEIDELLQGYLEDAPMLRPLQRFVDNMPVKAEKTAETAAPPQSAEGQEKKSAPSQAAAGQQPTQQVETGQIATEADADKVIREVLKTVRQVADFFHAVDLSNPKGYRWRRVAGWSMIQALPPNTEKKTEIPPPAEHDVVEQNLTELKEKGNWEALVRTVEERFQGALLWLDLNRYAAEALEALGTGYAGAMEALCRETAFFIQRIPGIENLSYSDGTPFCDHETHQWLKGIRFGAGESGAGDGPVSEGAAGDAMAETLQKFQSLAKKRGKLPEAIGALQQEMLTSFSKRDRLLWRIGLAQALMNAKKTGLAKPHLDAILEDIKTYQLEEWDPVLAVRGLKVVLLGLKTGGDKAVQDESAGILGRIAKLDPVEGIRLGK